MITFLIKILAKVVMDRVLWESILRAVDFVANDQTSGIDKKDKVKEIVKGEIGSAKSSTINLAIELALEYLKRKKR
jgi:hypothetical protein